MSINSKLKDGTLTVFEARELLSKYDGRAKLRINRDILYVIQNGQQVTFGSEPRSLPSHLQEVTNQEFIFRAQAYSNDPEGTAKMKACVWFDYKDDFVIDNDLTRFLASGMMFLVEGRYIFCPPGNPETVMAFNPGFIEGVKK